jgi:hypothetical protein
MLPPARDVITDPARMLPPHAPARSVDKFLPTDFVPPAGVPIGQIYTLNGRRPIRVNLTDPNWQSQLPPDTGGVYILRHPNGQIYKPGKAEPPLTKRLGDYVRDWLPHLPTEGLPLLADVYPIPHLTKGLRHAEAVLRGFLRDEGWPLLSDGTKKHVKPNGWQGFSVGVEGP